MVFKRSEYRKQYKDPIWNCHFPHYKEKVDYRIYRRRMEHHHQIFDWDSSDSENGQGDVGAAPTAPNKNNNQGQGNNRRVPHHTDDPQTLSEMCLEQKKKSKEEPDTPQPDQVLQLVKPLRHKKPKTQRDGRTAVRPHTSPGGKRLDVGKERAPMIAFGWADRELETGSKKTHNIRASADPLQIYPSALRAMRRRELDIQRQQEQEKQSRKEQKLRALFNIQPRDDTMWTTEYRRNFIGPSR